MDQVAPTDERSEALMRALREHAALAASASKRAKTPAARIAHAEVEGVLLDFVDQIKAQEVPA